MKMTVREKTQKATAAMVVNHATRREGYKKVIIKALREAGYSLTLAEISTATGYNKSRTYRSTMELVDAGLIKFCGPHNARRFFAAGQKDTTLPPLALTDEQIEAQIMTLIRPGVTLTSKEIYAAIDTRSKTRIQSALVRLLRRQALYCSRLESDGGYHYSDVPLEAKAAVVERPYRIQEIRTETGARRVQFGDHYKLVSSRPNPSRPAIGASPLEWGR
jgi:predicted transcriptional regulator